MLIDSHCHLNFPELFADLDGVLARARAADVGRMVAIGTKLREFDQVRAIAEAHGDVYCTVGIHPHEAEAEPGVQAAALIAETGHRKVVGIGETGLDYFYESAPREAQKINFRAHIAAVRETGLPLIVHTRDADADTAEILRQEMEQGAFTGVIHCFTASAEFARIALDLGFYISLSGIVTFKTAVELRETAKSLPLDRLLIETDAPYLAPVPKRGKSNEPAFVAHTAAYLADLYGLSLAELGDITSSNFFRLFQRVPA